MLACGLVDGVRPILENSTACQKSMPIPRLVAVVALPLSGVVLLSLRTNFFPLVDNDHLAVIAGCSCSARFHIPLWVMFFPCFGEGIAIINGEFDPGSGRTLAACLTHASRAERPLRWYSSGERVSNT